MKFWKSLQFTDTEDMVAVATLADTQTHFHGVYLGDHWLTPLDSTSGYPTTPDGKPPYADDAHWPHIAGISGILLASTQNLHVTTSIITLPLYDPFDIARMCGTLGRLYGDRFSLGTGVGWSKDEYDALGIDFSTRGGRHAETIEVVRALLSSDSAEYHGKHFDFAPVGIAPRPATPTRILPGGFSPIALKRAARLGDGWQGAPLDPVKLRENLHALFALLDQEGRSRDEFEIRVPFRGDDVDYLHELEELGVDGILCTPPEHHFAVRQSREEKIDDMFRMNEVVESFLKG